MQFEPLGGFPPIIRVNDEKPSEKTLESRGFPITRNGIVNIGNILKAKKDELYFTLGSDEQEGNAEFMIDGLFDTTPHNYDSIHYNEHNKKKYTRGSRK